MIFRTFILLFLISCASRGLKLSEQIPKLHDDYSSNETIAFIEKDQKIEKENLYLYRTDQRKFFESYFEKINSRNIATVKILKEEVPEFEKSKVNISSESVGVMLNDITDY